MFEEDIRQDLNTLDDATGCIRYCLMEYGSFVRETSHECSVSSYVHPRKGNFLVWSHCKVMAENTDEGGGPSGGHVEGGEEEPSQKMKKFLK